VIVRPGNAVEDGAQDPSDDLRALLARFAELVAIARTAGMQAAWLTQTSEMQVAALVELAEHRAGGRDPRRRASLKLAARIARERARGATVAALVERFNLKRSRIYQLLALVREHERTDLRLTLCEPVETEPS
jgi:hypothetical protein